MSELEWKEDLPPVDCECEVYLPLEDLWSQGRVTAYGKSHFLLLLSDNITEVSLTISHKFRPVRSKQEIEREEAIDKMAELAHTGSITDTFTKSVCERIYDAGCRNNGEEISYDDLHTFVKQRELAINPTAELIKNFKIYPRNP